MTDETKHTLDYYVNELWDLINNKADNLTDLYNIYKDDNITIYEKINKDDILKQMFVKIDDIIKYFKDEEHKDIINYLYTTFGAKFKNVLEWVSKSKNPRVGETIKLPSGKEYYIPSDKEKQVFISASRYCFFVNELKEIIHHPNATNMSVRQIVKSHKSLLYHNYRSKQYKLEEQQTKQEYQKYSSIENTKHNTDIYINIDKHPIFEDILKKLKEHGLVDENNKWIHTKTTFTYFCYVLAQNVFFYGSEYNKDKDKYSVPWKNAEKLFHLENTNSSTVIQNIIKGKALNKTAKDDIDNILKVYNLTIPTF